MIPLYCIVDSKPIPDERVRRGAKTCDKECQRLFRRAFLLDRKERYRKAAGLPPSQKSTKRTKEQCSWGYLRCGPHGYRDHIAPSHFSSTGRRLKASEWMPRRARPSRISLAPLVVPEAVSFPVSNSHALPRRRNKTQRKT